MVLSSNSDFEKLNKNYCEFNFSQALLFLQDTHRATGMTNKISSHDIKGTTRKIKAGLVPG